MATGIRRLQRVAELGGNLQLTKQHIPAWTDREGRTHLQERCWGRATTGEKIEIDLLHINPENVCSACDTTNQGQRTRLWSQISELGKHDLALDHAETITDPHLAAITLQKLQQNLRHTEYAGRNEHLEDAARRSRTRAEQIIAELGRLAGNEQIAAKLDRVARTRVYLWAFGEQIESDEAHQIIWQMWKKAAKQGQHPNRDRMERGLARHNRHLDPELEAHLAEWESGLEAAGDPTRHLVHIETHSMSLGKGHHQNAVHTYEACANQNEALLVVPGHVNEWLKRTLPAHHYTHLGVHKDTDDDAVYETALALRADNPKLTLARALDAARTLLAP